MAYNLLYIAFTRSEVPLGHAVCAAEWRRVCCLHMLYVVSTAASTIDQGSSDRIVQIYCLVFVLLILFLT